MDNADAESSKSTSRARESESGPLTPRQRAKTPVRQAAISLSDVRLDQARLDKDIELLISQYLNNHHASLAKQFDEEVLGQARDDLRLREIEEVEHAILDGDYGNLENLLSKPGLVRPQTQKAFLYMCFRQQFLEHIDNRESQKAFNLLSKRLKPLEHYQPVPYDFYSLCYLTSASTVHDAPAMRDWGGAGPERERLMGMWREIVESRVGADGGEGGEGERPHVPPDRLRVLFRQAAAWQVSTAISRGKSPWTVKTLLRDHETKAVPSRLIRLVEGHRANVKCVDILDPHTAVSGSSDSTLRIFSTENGETKHVLSGHSSRIWDCAVSSSSSLVASASGDGTVQVWTAADGSCRAVLDGDAGDVYGICWRPDREDHVVSASYDKIIRLWDIETCKQVRTFSGHSQSILAVAFDPTGNVIASGSKDKLIRLWDAVAGVCIHTMTAVLGEITSVEIDDSGRYLLAGCKDNSNRLYDLRMHHNLHRYIGHQNTAKNLIRCSFASTDLVVGGSEDGLVYLWEREGSGLEAAKPHALLSPNGTAGSSASSTPYTSPPGFQFTPSSSANSRTSSLTVPTASSGPRVSPAYYPPREARSVAMNGPGGGNTIRPLSVLEGHGDGPVYDVKWSGEGMVSAAEDGTCGVWGIEGDKDDCEVHG